MRPWDLAFCRNMGLEVEQWIKRGLLDYVSPTETWVTSFNMPISSWVKPVIRRLRIDHGTRRPEEKSQSMQGAVQTPGMLGAKRLRHGGRFASRRMPHSFLHRHLEL